MLKLSRTWTAVAVISILMFFLGSPVSAKESKSGWLGVMVHHSTDDEGVTITDVVEDGPAQMAGLEEGDVIIEFAGMDLEDAGDLTKAVRAADAGDEVQIIVLRDGKKKKFKVELGEREKNTWVIAGDEGKHIQIKDLHKKIKDKHHNEDVFVWHEGDDDNIKVMVKGLEGLKSIQMDRGFMGVELDDLNDQMGEYFEVKDGEGALITNVIEDTAAEKAGLRAGDVIVKMGDEDIKSAGDVHEVLGETKPEDELKVVVLRKGKKKKLDLTLGELPEKYGMNNFQFFGEDNQFTVKAPKMLLHGDHDFPHIEREIRIIGEGDEELDEMKDELKKLKEELEKLKEELKR